MSFRIALGISYTGNNWKGWQTQPHGQTVQDMLEIALSRLSNINYKLKTICAGRTDAGVHAAMQVIHFDTLLNRKMKSWVHGLNFFLPSSISVQWAKPVSSDFHARFSAYSRTYVYLLYCADVLPALLVGRVGLYIHSLNINCLKKAALMFLGKHNFNNFRSTQCQANNPIRTIYSFDVEKRGPFFIFILCANGFLHHMVRNLIGILIQVNRNYLTFSTLERLLNGKIQNYNLLTFCPNGLYLSAVTYPEKFELIESDATKTLLATLSI